jgi:hypothetical protein
MFSERRRHGENKAVGTEEERETEGRSTEA